MEADLLKRLITYHEPFNLELDDDKKYNIALGFRDLDYSTRMTFMRCNECRLIKHKVIRRVNGFTKKMDPDKV